MIRVRPPLLQLPYDVLRWGFDTTFHEGLPPDEPEVLRLIAGVSWRVEAKFTPGRAALMLDEVRRLFRVSVRTAESAVREAYDLTMQSRLEALILPKLPRETIDAWVRVTGDVPASGLVVVPHAGHLLLLATALGLRVPDLIVFSARGIPPRPRRGLGAVGDTWINRHLARAREADEARLPLRWEQDAEAVGGHLAAGRLVVAAFDDRAWSRYTRVPFNERESLLSDQPWALARDLGVPVVPAFIRREHDKTHVVRIGAPIAPDLPRYLADEALPVLATNPGHYAMWLAECRMRAGMDDHPLFIDYAVDTRWMRWPEL